MDQTLIEMTYDFVESIDASLKVDNSLFEFRYLRDASLVQLLQVVVLREALQCSPNPLAISR